ARPNVSDVRRDRAHPFHVAVAGPPPTHVATHHRMRTVRGTRHLYPSRGTLPDRRRGCDAAARLLPWPARSHGVDCTDDHPCPVRSLFPDLFNSESDPRLWTLAGLDGHRLPL